MILPINGEVIILNMVMGELHKAMKNGIIRAMKNINIRASTQIL